MKIYTQKILWIPTEVAVPAKSGMYPTADNSDNDDGVRNIMSTHYSSTNNAFNAFDDMEPVNKIDFDYWGIILETEEAEYGR